MATYNYNAAGEKLSVAYSIGGGGYTYSYCGNFIYRNGTLEKILIDGGYITLSGTTPTYHYYLQDHLCNNRVVCNAFGTVEQVNHYYPYGGLFGESTNGGTQVYKYNGKELDRISGLDWYDYGARHMSPDIGRFTTIDPMAEKYYNASPYAYCGNNPVNAIDPDGKDWYKDKDGTIQYNPKVHSQNDLLEGQIYLWKAMNDKKAGVDYRNDGSILYKDETEAYKRMWNQADQHYRTKDNKGGREVGGFILSDGTVLVLPDYANDANNSYISKYGYKINKDGTLLHGDEKFNVLGNIHTHQDKSISASPSFYTYDGYGDMETSIQMGGKPVLTIGWDGEIHGIRSNNINTLYQIPFSRNLRQRKNLFNGYTKLSKILKRR